MIDGGDDGRIAAHGADHPVVVLGAAFAVGADSFGIPVLELAHQGGQVVVQAVGVVGGHDELAGYRGVAAFGAFGRFLGQQDLGPVFVSGDSGVGAGSAVAQDDHVIFGVPCDLVFRPGLIHFQAGARHGQTRGANGGAFQEGTAGNVLFHRKDPFHLPYMACFAPL